VNRIPLADFASFTRAANRTAVVRLVLAALAAAVLVAAALVARQPHVRTVAPLAPTSQRFPEDFSTVRAFPLWSVAATSDTCAA